MGAAAGPELAVAAQQVPLVLGGGGEGEGGIELGDDAGANLESEFWLGTSLAGVNQTTEWASYGLVWSTELASRRCNHDRVNRGRRRRCERDW